MPSVLILSSNTIVYKRTLVASLDSNGTIGIDLPATNDPDVVPTDWTYAVTELIGDNRPRMYNIKVDYQGPPIDLAVVAPVTPVTPSYPIIPYSLKIGTVTTLDPNTPATANIRGNSPNQIIDLGIPAGKSGTSGAGTTLVYNQGVANSTWTINHGLDKYPSVTVVDSSGNEGFTTVKYIDSNNIILTFSSSFAGQAFLN